MKTKLTLSLSLLLAVGFTNLGHAAAAPAPLPEFMDKQQLAKWSADTQTAEANATAADPASTQFYTGKPYVANEGGYVYKYRTYNPDMSRWTSADPSGFPDGANDKCYASIPLSNLDPTGLFSVTGPTSSTGPTSYTDPVTNESWTIIGLNITESNLSSAAGTATITTYQTFIGPDIGGIGLQVTLSGVSSSSWFGQQIFTNSPFTNPDGSTPSYVGDPDLNGYYSYTDGGNPVYGSGTNYNDTVQRPLPGPLDTVSWNGTLAMWDGSTLLGDITFGFTISE
jgi:RHS repeat-associated protein